MHGFNREELKILKKLNTPRKVQDFVNAIPMNFEKRGETCMSPRMVLQRNKAHCLEGAMLASSAFWMDGQKPLLLDLKTVNADYEHVVSLFKQHGHWGAVSKTNHAVLRYRDPVYKTVRELAMSYFNEYFLDKGQKSLRSFSKPFDLSQRKFDGWTVSVKDLWHISDALDNAPHEQILTRSMLSTLRRADKIEIKASDHIEWKRSN